MNLDPDVSTRKEAVLFNESPDHSESDGSAYRAYFMGAEGRIVSAVPILASSDEDAVRQAKALTHIDAIELWDRGRIMLRLPKHRQAEQ